MARQIDPEGVQLCRRSREDYRKAIPSGEEKTVRIHVSIGAFTKRIKIPLTRKNENRATAVLYLNTTLPTYRASVIFEIDPRGYLIITSVAPYTWIISRLRETTRPIKICETHVISRLSDETVDSMTLLSPH